MKKIKKSAATEPAWKDGFRPFPDGPGEKIVKRVLVLPSDPSGKAFLGQVDFLVELKIPLVNPSWAERPGEDTKPVRVTVTCAPPNGKDLTGRVYVADIQERLWLARAVLDRIQESRSALINEGTRYSQSIRPVDLLKEEHGGTVRSKTV